MTSTVLLDCDGVIADLLGAVLSQLRSAHGTAPWAHEIRQWDFITHHLDPAQQVYVRDLMGSQDFWTDLPLVEGAKKALTAFAAADLSIELVTSPWTACQQWNEARFTWVNRYLAGFPINEVHILDDKSSVQGRVFVDDKPDNVKAWIAGPRQSDDHAFIFDQPYNTSFGWDDRLYGWTEDSIESVIRYASR